MTITVEFLPETPSVTALDHWPPLPADFESCSSLENIYDPSDWIGFYDWLWDGAALAGVDFLPFSDLDPTFPVSNLLKFRYVTLEGPEHLRIMFRPTPRPKSTGDQAFGKNSLFIAKPSGRSVLTFGSDFLLQSMLDRSYEV